MLAGTAAALVVPGLLPGLPEAYTSLAVLALGMAASLAVCLATAPESDEVLKGFYRSVRPWGFWGPICAKCRADDPGFQKNRDLRRDAFNLAVGLVWQTTLVTAPIYLVIQHWTELWISLAVCLATSLILKFTWYDRLGPGEMYMTSDR